MIILSASPYSNSLEGKIAFTDDLIRIFSLCCQKIDFFNRSHFAFVQFLFIYFSEKFNVLWYVNWTREAGKILKKFETDIIDKTKNDGYNGNEDLAEVQWNFAGALLYSVTVITTIGKKKIRFFEKRPKIPHLTNGKNLYVQYIF